MVCSSAPHLQAAEDVIPHLSKQEWKHLTPVQKQLSQIHAVLRRVIPGGWVSVSGMKEQSISVVQPPCLPSVIHPDSRRYVVR